MSLTSFENRCGKKSHLDCLDCCENATDGGPGGSGWLEHLRRSNGKISASCLLILTQCPRNPGPRPGYLEGVQRKLHFCCLEWETAWQLDAVQQDAVL